MIIIIRRQTFLKTKVISHQKIAGRVASQRCSVLVGAFVAAPAHHQLKKHQLVAENLRRNIGKNMLVDAFGIILGLFWYGKGKPTTGSPIGNM